ncbi:DSBA oxidoreductase [Sporormia fimetaria CBS 119925]|uniref:DSBA oxidoreductase n=1 Tax=Sporormia fimetaria CBS 119925 TaxID=1340428 RepID=A0A6A6V021_9PLEO|nr:DSBA oxidoreductase [Sporormia fimetaria CBS 119925]
MTHFNISIVSDNVCPWCYIGKKRLESAITLYKKSHPSSNDTFSTSWHPFYLNPDAPKTSVDKRSYYASKFGAERTEMIWERMINLGEQEGINFVLGGKTGNTRDSHRLVQLGKTKSAAMETRVIEVLFEAYFEKSQDITDKNVLVELGVKAGLEEKEVREWMESDKGGKEVDREVKEAYERGVSGVPNFVINGRFEIGGAQEPAAFVQLFERLKRLEGGSGGGVVGGPAPKC